MVLLFASIVIKYVDRGNLVIAAVPLKRQFGLSPVPIGALLSAFLWTTRCFKYRVDTRWSASG